MQKLSDSADNGARNGIRFFDGRDDGELNSVGIWYSLDTAPIEKTSAMPSTEMLKDSVYS